MTKDLSKPKFSILHSILSLVIPGLGQMVSGAVARGGVILAVFLGLGWLSVWTIAQKARFPDLVLSRGVFFVIFLQVLALLLFVIALQYVFTRYIVKDPAGEVYASIGLGILYAAALFLVQEQILAMAGTEEILRQVHGNTAVLAAGALAAYHIWQIRDAGIAGSGIARLPTVTGAVLLACLVIFSLGWSITGINLPKAISEYTDTQIILRRIVWPWKVAFEYEQIAVESTAQVQAPCPDGATGPEPNEPGASPTWIRVTPTCGDLSERDLRLGELTVGTELTIEGGGYLPGAVVEILWKNPIGNPFTPRGVGETKIEIASDGTFETVLNIPEVVIPSTAVGDQIHTLIVRQESGEVFTGKPSREIKLALIGILETIMIGLMATFFGVILAFPFSFLAARNLMAPISSNLGGIIGGLLGLVPALWAVQLLVRRFTESMGGLDAAPIQIAAVGLVLLLAFGYIGVRLGSTLINVVLKNVSVLIGRGLAGISLALMAGVVGYYFGLWFSRGIVSIPLGEEVAAINEMRYAWGGSGILGLFGLVFGFLRAEYEFSIGIVVYTISRTLMNIIRSIEPLIWAIVGSIWVGLGPFAGTIALTLHTIAALGKLYSESIESIDPGPIEALQATGADRLQTIVYAVVPQVLPPFISFTIYRWDINVRMSTVIGLVGGGGIGFILIQWIRQFQYESAGLAVWLITITVATLDFVSSSIRERFV